MTSEERIKEYTSARNAGNDEQALQAADNVVRDYRELMKSALKMESIIHDLVKKLEQYEAW